MVDITPEIAREMIKAEERWTWCKTYIEPNIAAAADDESAAVTGFLPNHEFVIRGYEKFMAVIKCRKIAHSWSITLKALARAVNEPRSTTIIQSIDEDEAKEKNNFLEWQYGVLPAAMRASLKMSPGSEVRKFRNGSRIMMVPRKAKTGAGASFELDEFSVEPKGLVSSAEILTAALGATTHRGQVCIGGTQRGEETMFNKIVSGEAYKGIHEGDPLFKLLEKCAWRIGKFPWWSSPALCNDVEQAFWEAETMDTANRVDRFGNDKLKFQYFVYTTTPLLGLEMFQREFEMKILDDKESFYSLELVRSCYATDEDYWFEHTEVEGTNYNKHQDVLKEAKSLIDQLARAIATDPACRGEYGIAFDVGRDNDRDEILIGHTLGADSRVLALRLSIGMDDMPFDGKKEIFAYAIDNLPITRGLVDSTRGGLGRQLGEELNNIYGQLAMPFQFTQQSKQVLASGLKARMQKHMFLMPHPEKKRFEKLRDQILKVKKIVTNAGNVLFDVERNKSFHGDCYWACTMLADLFSHDLEWSPERSVVTIRNADTGHHTRMKVTRGGILIPK